MGWNDFRLPAVGERYDNEDGSSRQLEIMCMLPGDPVALVRQPDNPHDHMAVAIFTTTSRTCVGYLGRVKAQWIGAKMDRGFAISAVVDRIRGTGMNGSPVGLVLRINMEGEDPDPSTGSGMDRNVVSSRASEEWPPSRQVSPEPR